MRPPARHRQEAQVNLLSGNPADMPAAPGLPRGFASPDLSGFAPAEGSIQFWVPLLLDHLSYHTSRSAYRARLIPDTPEGLTMNFHKTFILSPASRIVAFGWSRLGTVMIVEFPMPAVPLLAPERRQRPPGVVHTLEVAVGREGLLQFLPGHRSVAGLVIGEAEVIVDDRIVG